MPSGVPPIDPFPASGDFSGFEAFIAAQSYVEGGATWTKTDLDLYQRLKNKLPDMAKFPHTYRWASHVATLKTKLPLAFSNTVKGAPGAQQTGQTSGAKEEPRQKGKDEASLEGKLPNAEMGKVCTRFPPEPSGYMHIGHSKAALLNWTYAKMYKGKMILRFDDTNPAKEKAEYEDAFVDDIKSLGIKPHMVSHTSDYFPLLQDLMEDLLKRGDAYVDDTPVDQMREWRDAGTPSPHRTAAPADNLKLWKEMLLGSETGLKCCVRGKMNMSDPIKCLRDPVFYRCKVDTPHHVHGTKYKAYPTYDWACPIVDAVEGVTHALRTTEYRDRDLMYKWVQDKAGKGKTHMYEFAKTEFTYTVLSKRKLRWFVEQKLVQGWNDPRFPTVKGILRRGMQTDALENFMKTQGASKNNVLMEWDKLWALNRQHIDPVAHRYSAVTDKEDKIPVKLSNYAAVVGNNKPFASLVPRHPKDPALGKKVMWHADTVYLEQADLQEGGAKKIEVGTEITLMKWGNVIVDKIEKDAAGKVLSMQAKLHPEGNPKDTKSKVHWVAASAAADTTPLVLREFDHLINVPNLDKEDGNKDDVDQFAKYVNKQSLFDTAAIGEPALKNVTVGEVIQLERIGFFICDQVALSGQPMILHKIPDGKSKAMGNVKGEVDAAKLQGGGSGPKKGEKGEKKKQDAAAAASAASAAAPTSAGAPVATPASTEASAEDQAALVAAKEKVKALKTAGVSGPELDAALAEMKRLKEVCGEVELSKAERKKLEKAQKAAGKK